MAHVHSTPFTADFEDAMSAWDTLAIDRLVISYGATATFAGRTTRSPSV